MIGFQHWRKISSILFRNTLTPTVTLATPGNYLVIEGFKTPKTRSCYEYHPVGCSKKVRTAVGRQIWAAGAGSPVQKERRWVKGSACSQSQKEKPPPRLSPVTAFLRSTSDLGAAVKWTFLTLSAFWRGSPASAGCASVRSAPALHSSCSIAFLA